MKLFENNYRSRFKLTSDQVFYWVYGMDTEESKRALIALLNVVLDRKDDPIIEVRLLNPVQKGFVIGDKPTVMDIKCETSSGELIDVEMQNGRLPFYPERSLFYGGKMVNSALEEGEDYDKMKKSIVISFVDRVLFPDIPGIHTRFLVKEEDTGHPLTDRLAMHFVELGKVSADRPVEELDPLERFAAYMKYCSDPQMEDYVNQLLDSGEEAVHARREGLAEGRAEGRTEGRAEGRTEGRAEGRMEGRAEGIVTGVQQMKQALGLSAKGKTPEEIATELNLSIEIVRDMLDLEAVIE